ncbi:MAG: type II toxin-antitoxin system VapC family toxin [Candidatus Bathyarchaeia archaeon]
MTFLDTCVIIDFLAGDEEIVALVKELVKKEEIKTTAITEYELLKHKTQIKKNAAEKFLSAVTVCSFDRASARKAALLFEKLSKAGKVINENDLLIAGTALSNNEVLFTRDQKFRNIDDANIKIV